MIALDTETTGVDFHHGARPFFVTTCDNDDNQRFWEWEVDPYTREVQVESCDVEEIMEMVQTNVLILQNAKFDVTALGFVDAWFRNQWPWKRTYDTIISAHMLGSGYPRNLTDMVSQYLSKNIQPLEDKLQEACISARRLARRKLPEWRIAKFGDEMLPSLKKSSKEDKAWRNDYWLPKALVKELGYDRIASETENYKHGWDTVLEEYANADSFYTLKLWKVMRHLLEERDLWEIFLERMKLLPVAFKMEHRGITLSADRLEQQKADYEVQSAIAGSTCIGIARKRNFDLNLPKSGNNNKLISFIFDVLKLEQRDGTSLNKDTLEHFIQTLPPDTQELEFIKNLAAKRKRDTALSYIAGYQRYWLPLDVFNKQGRQLWYCLHPNLNPTGTAHLRWSCKNPNEQNISKQEGFNLRYMFGPAPGREWWSLDYQNLELRIPAFEAGEKDLIEVFLKPKEAPYFGSYHLVVFDLLYPDLFKQHGKACKDLYESTLYQWVKNGNFCLIYGAQKKKADATYHYAGAYELVRYRFPKIAQLSDRQLARANKTGGIETIPDKNVNPRRGYPIMCAFGDWGKVKPTLPLNYHISGTAMQCTGKAMIRCDDQLEEWNSKGYDGFINMQVHDEMVFDLPAIANPLKYPEKSNLGKVRALKKLMEMSGDDIGVPTPVSVEYHKETWDVGSRF